jgi:hypothetical protein
MRWSNGRHIAHLPVDQFHPVVLVQDTGFDHQVKLLDADAVDWVRELLSFHRDLQTLG